MCRRAGSLAPRAPAISASSTAASAKRGSRSRTDRRPQRMPGARRSASHRSPRPTALPAARPTHAAVRQNAVNRVPEFPLPCSIPSRDDVASLFCDTWAKQRSGQILTPLEATALRWIEVHPEYHALLDAPERALSEDFSIERGASNPFLHLSMHLALDEQVAIDQLQAYVQPSQAWPRAPAVNIPPPMKPMECLGEIVWQAQRSESAGRHRRDQRRLPGLPGAPLEPLRQHAQSRALLVVCQRPGQRAEIRRDVFHVVFLTGASQCHP